MKVARKPASRTGGSRKDAARDTAKDTAAPARRRGADGTARKRRTGDGPARDARPRSATRASRPPEPRGLRQGPQTAPAPRPTDRPARAKTTSQAKARAKARKAKAPKAVRTPLRERLLARLTTVDLRPQTLLARVPFVVLIIGSLAIGLAITLWLSTDAAQRSYQLGNARELNAALAQQKEALERDVLEAQSAPALADSARDLGMIPSKDTAHLVQDPAGNWVVIGQPKPAEGVPPPPLNTTLPEELPPGPKPAAPNPLPPASALLMPGAAGEVPVRLTPGLPGALGIAGQGVPALVPSATDANPHTPAAGAALPGPIPLPGPALPGPALPGSLALPGPLPLPLPLPTGDTLAIPPVAAVGAPVPTVALVPPVTAVAAEVAPVGVAH
jgi:hypothetical protein